VESSPGAAARGFSAAKAAGEDASAHNLFERREIAQRVAAAPQKLIFHLHQ
jgi:hypothetical protein